MTVNIREKLVELLEECTYCTTKETSCIADHLIANGVTMQGDKGINVPTKWISVTERLPSDEQDVLVIAHGWDGRLVYVGSHKRVEAQKSWITGITNKSSEWLLWGWSYLKEPMVTHWMPIPRPLHD